MKKLRVGVIGATGYTGEEIVRLLARHPRVEVTYASGKEERNLRLQEIFPYLQGRIDLECRAFSPEEALKECDFVFLSLPHTVSMRVAPLFLKAAKPVVDTSADYRLKDVKIYERFYKTPHADPVYLKRAVYGLPELHRARIKKAKLIANPGCYPTAAILGVLPGFSDGLFHPKGIVIDAKSGVTGAGRKADKALLFSEVNESFKAYKVFEHQHVPEMNQELTQWAKKAVDVVFVPHLLPLNRGILSTIYVSLAGRISTASLVERYRSFYAQEPFVRVLENGALPEVKHAAHTNFCHIGLRVDETKKLAVIVTAIDNLGKGAAGQAIQNMNLMRGFDEREGLYS
ncbi:MAG: N-acetyl-gamma-glutamyl-phosphate reductase [Candidatus Omnitrophica bacterium]|nr:N-acetyl-gamma-glutamyl-phosphate reductase [Candidatus Omnitrophota bacterium]